MFKLSRSGLILLFGLALVISGCGGGGGGTKPPVDPTIFIGGSYYDSTAHQDVPCYWTGTTITPLAPTGNTDAGVNSIYVANQVVYAGGGYYNNGSNRIGGYWEGTTFHPHSESNVLVGGIFVANNIIYTNGWYNYTPTYWTGNTKNSTDLPLHSEDDHSTVTSIFVANGIVYSGGSTYKGTTGNQKPCYWQGTTLKSLPLNGAARGSVDSIFVSDGKVYSCGTVTIGTWPMPCYWEDQNNPVLLSIGGGTFGEATGIYIANGKIYISGWYAGDYVYSCFWTLPDQTAPTVFTLPTGSNGCKSTSIFVLGSTPYISGWYQLNAGALQYPCYWNGATQTLTTLNLPTGIIDGETTSIFVTQ